MMKPKMASVIIFVLAVLATPVRGEEITLESARPVVIKSVPEAGAADVDPAITQISVTFSKPMQAGTWSWCVLSKESYPGTSERPKYLDDKRTCVLPVKLQPGKTYAVWINSEKFFEFKDAKGQPAVPFFLVFKTRVR